MIEGYTQSTTFYNNPLKGPNSLFVPITIAVSLVGMIFQAEFTVGTLNLMWGEPFLLMSLFLGLLEALHRRTVRRTILDVPIALYIFSLVCSLLVARLNEQALGIFRKELIAILVFYVIVWNMHSRNSSQIIAGGIVVATLAASTLALIQHFSPQSVASLVTPIGFAGQGIYRGLVSFLLKGTPSLVKPVYIPFRHFNSLGAFLAMVLPFVVAIALWVRRLPLVLIVSMAAIALYLTHSRGGWIGFLVGFGILGWLYLNGTRHRSLGLFFSVAIIVLLILFAIILFRTDYALTLNLVDARLPLWHLVIEQAFKYPFFGLGLGEVRKYLGTYSFNYSAHSDYIQVLGDRGLFGLISMLQILIFGIIAGLRAVRKGLQQGWIYIGATCGLAAYMVHATIDHPMIILTFKVLIFTYLALIATAPGSVQKGTYTPLVKEAGNVELSKV